MLPTLLHRYIHSNKHIMQNFYLDMIVEADKHINNFVTYFSKTKHYDNTYVMFTSDHGEMGFSKNLLQKWYVPYREAIHVPFIIHHKNIKTKIDYNYVTSSLDIVPTIISIACGKNDLGINKYGRSLRHIVMNALSAKYDQRNGYDNYTKEDIEYVAMFQTEDDIFEGDSAFPIYYIRFPILTNMLINVLGRNEPITCPKYIKTIISFEDSQLFKLSKYYYKNAEEWEMFNMTLDPSETVNVICDTNYKKIIDIMKIKMIEKFSSELCLYKSKL
jgi:hypothetical protein